MLQRLDTLPCHGMHRVRLRTFDRQSTRVDQQGNALYRDDLSGTVGRNCRRVNLRSAPAYEDRASEFDLRVAPHAQ